MAGRKRTLLPSFPELSPIIADEITINQPSTSSTRNRRTNCVIPLNNGTTNRLNVPPPQFLRRRDNTSFFYSTPRVLNSTTINVRPRSTSRCSFFGASFSAKKLEINQQQSDKTVLAYCDYLQACMKEEILRKTVKKHEEDMRDQLILQKDSLFKMQVMLKEAEKRNKESDNIKQICEISKTLDKNFIRFNDLGVFTSDVRQLLDHLNFLSRLLYLKGIQVISSEEVIYLERTLQQFRKIAERIVAPVRNPFTVNQLAGLLELLSKKKSTIEEKQILINQLETNNLYKLLKHLSDFYAQKSKGNMKL